MSEERVALGVVVVSRVLRQRRRLRRHEHWTPEVLLERAQRSTRTRAIHDGCRRSQACSSGPRQTATTHARPGGAPTRGRTEPYPPRRAAKPPQRGCGARFGVSAGCLRGSRPQRPRARHGSGVAHCLESAVAVDGTGPVASAVTRSMHPRHGWLAGERRPLASRHSPQGVSAPFTMSAGHPRY